MFEIGSTYTRRQVNEKAAVPVFAKKAANAYEHLGAFKGESYVSGVLVLAPA